MKTSMTTTAKPITEVQKAVNCTTMAGFGNAFQRGRSGMLITPPQ